MNRKSVSSSNIASVGYNSHTLVLEIEFCSGGIYHYFDVLESEYESLMGASSIGGYFVQYVKNEYRCVKIF